MFYSNFKPVVLVFYFFSPAASPVASTAATTTTADEEEEDQLITVNNPDDESWKAKLNLPKKDTRITTSVCFVMHGPYIYWFYGRNLPISIRAVLFNNYAYDGFCDICV